jgi:hypothetical protein
MSGEVPGKPERLKIQRAGDGTALCKSGLCVTLPQNTFGDQTKGILDVSSMLTGRHPTLKIRRESYILSTRTMQRLLTKGSLEEERRELACHYLLLLLGTE